MWLLMPFPRTGTKAEKWHEEAKLGGQSMFDGRGAKRAHPPSLVALERIYGDKNMVT